MVHTYRSTAPSTTIFFITSFFFHGISTAHPNAPNDIESPSPSRTCSKWNHFVGRLWRRVVYVSFGLCSLVYDSYQQSNIDVVTSRCVCSRQTVGDGCIHVSSSLCYVGQRVSKTWAGPWLSVITIKIWCDVEARTGWLKRVAWDSTRQPSR